MTIRDVSMLIRDDCDVTFSMPTSVTALEKEMSRRARCGQEREISFSRESVVTFKFQIQTVTSHN